VHSAAECILLLLDDEGGVREREREIKREREGEGEREREA